LGQHLMRDYPELLRSVILDGVVALDINPNQQVPQSLDRGLRALFDACAQDPDCDKHFPDLEGVFLDTVEALNQNPARVPVTDPETGISYNAVLDGDDFMWLAIQLLYATEALPVIPKVIYDAVDGIFDVPRRVLPLLIFDRTSADGMYYTVMCAEDFDFRADELDVAGVYPELAKSEADDIRVLLEICSELDVPQLGPAVDEPVSSELPTLLFSGHFDPVTPPRFAAAVAETLDNHYAYTFPANGHGALLSNECAVQVMRAFLNNPAVEPDTRCIAETASLVFFTPGNTLMAPGARYLIDLANAEVARSLEAGESAMALAQLQPVLRATLVLLGLLAFPVVWCLGWAVSRLRQTPRERRTLARLAPWLGLALAALVSVFGALQFLQASGLAFLGNGLQGLVGVDRSFAWIYFFPLLIAALSIGMAVAALLAWIRGYWGVWARLYYSLTALLALAFSGMLASVGLMTVLFS
jgi:pimeloyl-ACP methyl ester carboxylesterase